MANVAPVQGKGMTEIYCSECGAFIGEADPECDDDDVVSGTCTVCAGVSSVAEADLSDNGHGP
ncbi:unnamed protein product [marine sediment metagenome]|uniref:Uncharacterized protein n=1 Tax=marine sediment metagenome TaxID=412755 RepID=X1IF65_9ZZZZ